MPVGEDVIEDALRKYPYYVPKEALAPIYTRSSAAEEAARAAGIDPTWGEVTRPTISLPNLPGAALRGLNMFFQGTNKVMQPLTRGIYEPWFTLGGGRYYPGGPIHPGLYPAGKQAGDVAADVASQLMVGAMLSPQSMVPEYAGEAWPYATKAEEWMAPQMRRLVGTTGVLGQAAEQTGRLEAGAPTTSVDAQKIFDETRYLPHGPPTKAAPELEAQPYRLHGTESPIYRMVEPDMITKRGQRMGPGFYTTDSYHVAEGYAHPSIARGAGGAGPIYRVYEVQPIKWLDAENQPIPKQALQRLATRMKDDRWLKFESQPAENVFKRFSDYSDASRANNEALVEELQAEGYGGLKHTGGHQVGSVPSTRHEVKVYWDAPNQVRIRSLGTEAPPVMGSYK